MKSKQNLVYFEFWLTRRPLFFEFIQLSIHDELTETDGAKEDDCATMYDFITYS